MRNERKRTLHLRISEAAIAQLDRNCRRLGMNRPAVVSLLVLSAGDLTLERIGSAPSTQAKHGA